VAVLRCDSFKSFSGVVGLPDLIRFVRVNPVLVRCFILGFVLVGDVVVMLNTEFKY
jgi:hypothetical protein